MRMVVEIRMKLAESGPETQTSKLATSYFELGNCLDEAGKYEEALHSYHSAIALCRLSAGGISSTPILAGSLSMLTSSLLRLNRHAEAVSFAQEAVELYRGLAEQDPESFRWSLCSSLVKLQTCRKLAGNSLRDHVCHKGNAGIS